MTTVKWHHEPAQAGYENRKNWRLYNLHPQSSLSIESSVRKDLGKFVSQRPDLGDHTTGWHGKKAVKWNFRLQIQIIII